MDLSEVLTHVATFALAVLSLSLLVAFVRLRRGPTLTDRILALDLMTTIVMGLFGAYAIYSRQKVYVDVTVVLALIAFISTVVYAKHIERDADAKRESGDSL